MRSRGRRRSSLRLVVADSSSCILLQKCRLLERLAQSLQVTIEETVYRECAADHLCEKYPDARKLRELVNKQLLQVQKCKKLLSIPSELGPGEHCSLSLFMELEADLVVVDDGRAIKVCRYLDIPFTTALRVTLDLLESGAIDRPTAAKAIEKLRLVGRYSEDLVAAALAALHERR